MRELAPAKINLALDILGRRPDGYHELRMVMQAVSLCDTVTVEEGGSGFALLADGIALPAGKKSLEQQAAEAFFGAIGQPVPPLTVHLEKATPAYAVIDAGGVGYYLHISLETFSAVEHAQNARLYVHYIVREDAQILYGFATKVEREFFRHLISVSGVGGNTARMILSTYSPRELQGIITSGNAVLLKNVKGLGLKTAQKIIVELSGKLTGLAEGDTPAMPSAGGESLDEALSALVMLGFAKAPAEKALRGILRENPAVSVEDLVRMALKIL